MRQGSLASRRLFRPSVGHETILPGNETISCFGADLRKQRLVIKFANKTADNAGHEPGDSQMRILSFILAFAFVLVGPSMAGTFDSGLPGIGTFAYTGAPVVTPTPQMVVVAAR
jgi:hypothetical protein